MKRRFIKVLSIILSIMFAFQSSVFALSKRGSSGSEVRQIQEKLIRWGYLSGTADGIY